MATNAVTTSPVQAFNSFLTKHKAQLAAALPKHITADRMSRLALTAFSQNPDLQNCTPKSIFGAVVMASQLGLEIGVQGQAYLIPYGTNATFVPGWQGLVDLVNRSGRASVWTGAVRRGDDFDYSLGDTPFVKHRPGDEFDSPIEYVYAVGRVKGSDWPVIEVWSMAKVQNHLKQFNKVGKRHYALKDDNNMEMYARKVCLLQILKYMPKSVELASAMTASTKGEAGEPFTMDQDFNILPDDGTMPSMPADDSPVTMPQATADREPPRDPPAQQAAQADAPEFDSTPLPEPRRKMLLGLLEANAVSSKDVEKKFGVAWDDLKMGHFNDVRAFILNPS